MITVVPKDWDRIYLGCRTCPSAWGKRPSFPFLQSFLCSLISCFPCPPPTLQLESYLGGPSLSLNLLVDPRSTHPRIFLQICTTSNFLNKWGHCLCPYIALAHSQSSPLCTEGSRGSCIRVWGFIKIRLLSYTQWAKICILVRKTSFLIS